MASSFSKAQKKKSKLRLAISGPSGSGKTWSALEVAKGMAKRTSKRVAVIDTERGSASLYADSFDFDACELSAPFSPERYIEKIREAESNPDFGILVVDQITHEWNGPGGCLESNEEAAKLFFKGNTWSAWSKTTPRHQAFINAISQSPLHIIANMRSKTETVQEGGRVKKIGMKDEARDGTEYEFTIAFNLDHESHKAVASKDRSGLFKEPHLITEETGFRLIDWLESGAEEKMASHDQVGEATLLVANTGTDLGKVLSAYKVIDLDKLTAIQADDLIAKLRAKPTVTK